MCLKNACLWNILSVELQDWHCFKTFPDSSAVYETPIYFAVDWLNEHWILEKDDDYRFVYIGPKGSW